MNVKGELERIKQVNQKVNFKRVLSFYYSKIENQDSDLSCLPPYHSLHDLFIALDPNLEEKYNLIREFVQYSADQGESGEFAQILKQIDYNQSQNKSITAMLDARVKLVNKSIPIEFLSLKPISFGLLTDFYPVLAHQFIDNPKNKSSQIEGLRQSAMYLDGILAQMQGKFGKII